MFEYKKGANGALSGGFKLQVVPKAVRSLPSSASS